jgi:hypothetical protein
MHGFCLSSTSAVYAYIHHLMFRDWIDIDQAGLLSTHNAKHIPICLYTAGGIDAAMALSNHPAKEADQVSNTEVYKSLLRIAANSGEVPYQTRQIKKFKVHLWFLPLPLPLDHGSEIRA